MKMSGIMALVAAAAAVTSCSPSADTDSVSFENITLQSDYRMVGSAADYESDVDLDVQCSVDLMMPTKVYDHDIQPLCDSIMSIAVDTVGRADDSTFRAAFRRQAESLGYAVADTTLSDGNYDGLFSADGKVAALTNSTLAYAITVANYYPRAAHGMYVTRYVNYDIRRGQLFSLSDIITPEGLAALPTILRQTARSMSGFLGSTSITAIPDGGNFYVNCNDELVFVYQPYEIASYAQGVIAIPVEAYRLSDYFTPYGTKLLMDKE